VDEVGSSNDQNMYNQESNEKEASVLGAGVQILDEESGVSSSSSSFTGQIDCNTYNVNNHMGPSANDRLIVLGALSAILAAAITQIINIYRDKKKQISKWKQDIYRNANEYIAPFINILKKEYPTSRIQIQYDELCVKVLLPLEMKKDMQKRLDLAKKWEGEQNDDEVRREYKRIIQSLEAQLEKMFT